MEGTDLPSLSHALINPGKFNGEEGSSSGDHLGGRAIDRYNPIIGDERRCGGGLPLSSSRKPPLSPPEPPHRRQKKSETRDSDGPIRAHQGSGSKQSVGGGESRKGTRSKPNLLRSKFNYKQSGGFSLGASGSSRYLLSDDSAFNFDRASALVCDEQRECNETTDVSSSSSPISDQVLIIRVSLHCRGCERRVRNHISKIQGVTSFTTDFEEEKVTVIGDVTPTDVLASISKVKSAQLLAS